MSKKKKNKFANIIIVISILMGAFITSGTVYEYHRLATVIPSDVLHEFFLFWGGELLIIALRQIFGSDIIGKGKEGNI